MRTTAAPDNAPVRSPAKTPEVCYGFEVSTPDGRRYEVVVHDDGLAFRRPIYAEPVDCIVAPQ